MKNCIVEEIEDFQDEIRNTLKNFENGATVRDLFNVFKGTGSVPEIPGKSPIDLIAEVLSGMNDIVSSKTAFGTKFAIDTSSTKTDNAKVSIPSKPKKGKKVSNINVNSTCYGIFGCDSNESRVLLLLETFIFLAEHGVINDKAYWVERVRYKMGISAKQASVMSGKDKYFSRELGQVAGKILNGGYIRVRSRTGQFETKELTPKGVKLATKFVQLEAEGRYAEAKKLARTIHDQVK